MSKCSIESGFLIGTNTTNVLCTFSFRPFPSFIQGTFKFWWIEWRKRRSKKNVYRWHADTMRYDMLYIYNRISNITSHTHEIIVIIWPSAAYCCAILINSIFQYLEGLMHAFFSFASFFFLFYFFSSLTHAVAVVAFHTRTMLSVLRYFTISLISIRQA